MKKSRVLLIIATLLLSIASTVTAATPADHNTLFQNKQLNAGQRLASSDNRYQFEVQGDGNCVLYDRQNNSVLWASGIGSGVRLTLQSDGNLVMLDSSGSSAWQSGTAGTGAARLTLNDDGALVLYNGNTSVWRFYSITTDVPGALTADKNRGEWTLMVIPDTQGYTENWLPKYPYERMRQTFEWIVAISDQLNIQIVQSVGDMVESNNATEWDRVAECYNPLIANNIPAIPCAGNHDNHNWLNQTFSLSEYRKQPWWGGDNGGMHNTYQLFNFGNEKYLFLTLEFQPGAGAIVDWAEDVVDAYPDRKVIFSSHWNNDQVHFNQIINVKPNVIMSLAGHKCAEEYYVSNDGQTHNFVQNYQCNEGKMNIRYYKFKPLEDKVEWFTYSAVFGVFENDSMSQGSFTIVQLDGGPIGDISDPADGIIDMQSDASVSSEKAGCTKEESGKKNLIDFRDSHSIKSQKPILIAHRGGVITTQSPECSIAAIRLAKQQGYEMVELDIRKSKDHVPIVFHDDDMKKACGINKSIKDLNAAEIVKIAYVNTDQTICTLDQALTICRSLKLGLMLDVKITEDEKFFKKIVALIKKHGYENSSVTINGDPDLRKHLKEIALLTVTQDEFKKVQHGLSCDLRNKFWFGLPHRLPSEMVKLLQQNGAYVIPAINTFRYPADGHYELARKDIQRLNEAGADGYQIDSVYQPLFLEKKPEK